MQEAPVGYLGQEDPPGQATYFSILDFPGGSNGKESSCNAGDLGLIPESGRTPGRRHDKPLQYCVENPMDRGAWWATVHGVAKGQTRLAKQTQQAQQSIGPEIPYN